MGVKVEGEWLTSAARSVGELTLLAEQGRLPDDVRHCHSKGRDPDSARCLAAGLSLDCPSGMGSLTGAVGSEGSPGRPLVTFLEDIGEGWGECRRW